MILTPMVFFQDYALLYESYLDLGQLEVGRVQARREPVALAEVAAVRYVERGREYPQRTWES